MYWAVASDVLKPVAWVGARQAAQREQPRHEADLRIGFARLHELRHLVEACEGTSRWRRVGAVSQGAIAGERDRLGDVAERNESVSCTRQSLVLLWATPCRASRLGPA